MPRRTNEEDEVTLAVGSCIDIVGTVGEVRWHSSDSIPEPYTSFIRTGTGRAGYLTPIVKDIL